MVNSTDATGKDFEGLYYKVMQENKLLREETVSVELHRAEIEILRAMMVDQLSDLRDRYYFLFDRDEKEDSAEDAKLGKSDENNLVLNDIIMRRKELLESLALKLYFEPAKK